MGLSISVGQAIDLAHYFKEKNIKTTVPIKKLDNEQKKICYLAFKIVANATAKDLKSKKKGSVSDKQITAIKTKLIEAAPAEKPKELWYKVIAHKISSFMKGFANLFWRVGSNDLLTKAKDYYNDVKNAQKKIDKYHKGDPIGATTEEKKEARYKTANNKIESAKKAYLAKGGEVKLLMDIHNKLRQIELLGTNNYFSKEVAERYNLAGENKKRAGNTSQFEYHPLHKVMSDVLQIDNRKKEADGSLKYLPLENDILKPFEKKLQKIIADYDKAPASVKEKMDLTLESEYQIAAEKFSEKKAQLYETNKKEPTYKNSIAAAKANLEAEIAAERKLKAKEKLLSDKYLIAPSA